MPTSPSSAVIPIRRSTKEMLEGVKGKDTFDDLLQALLEITPPDLLRKRLDAKRRTSWAVVEARRGRAKEGGGAEERRSPAKQALLPRLAEAQWKAWESKGKVEVLGPRTVKWNLSSKKPRPPEGRISVVGGPGSKGTP